MGDKSQIEWTHATWNPWYGCHKVSAGCKNCYMFRDMPKYGRDPNVVVRSKTTFDAPLKWARTGKLEPGSRIFTCSWSDWFIAEADEWRAEAWEVIRKTPQYTYLILTKRPERIKDHLPPDWGEGYPNVRLGTSAENQAAYEKRIWHLLSEPAAGYFISCEPLLGPIDLGLWCLDCDAEMFMHRTIGEHPSRIGEKVDWVIVGGESGPGARPMHPEWARSIRDQCQVAGVAFFYKQNGGSKKVAGTWGGRVLDGRTWNEYPAGVPA